MAEVQLWGKLQEGREEGGGQNPFDFDHGETSGVLWRSLLQSVSHFLCFFYIFELIAKDIVTFFQKVDNVLDKI